MPIAAHRGFINTDFPAALRHQRLQLPSDDGDKRLCDREPVRIVFVRYQTPAESVRSGHARFQRNARWSNTFQASKFLHHTQATRAPQLASHFMFAALVVPRRSKPALRQWLGSNARQEPIKREIEIQA